MNAAANPAKAIATATSRVTGRIKALQQLCEDAGIGYKEFCRDVFGGEFGRGQSPVEQQWWAEQFREGFFKALKREAANETRLGRAITIFTEGLVLPSELHVFLSMFLVLETLFNTESGDTAHKVGIRLSRVVWGYRPADLLTPHLPYGWDSKSRLYEACKRLYRIRSNVIHGNRSFTREVTDTDKQQAHFLARRSLQTALLNPQLFNLYSAKETERKADNLRQFFLDLELGGNGNSSG